MPETSPSVLIIRLDAIGDALALTPLLAAFRARGIPVDLVLREANAQVFSAAAARRIDVAPFALRSSEPANLAAIARFGAELATRGYTHALVPTEDPGGYRLARASRAPVRIGFTNGLGKPLKSVWARAFLTHAVRRPAGMDARAPHEAQVVFELGRTLLPGVRPPRDAAQLRPLLLDAQPAPDDRVAFQVSDKWGRLGMAFEDVVACVVAAGTTNSLRLIAAGGEGAYADRISGATGLAVERFDSTLPWKTAIAAAAALIAPDSGAVHVAGMLGTPVVAVFPPQRHFDRQVARWAPWAAPYRIVRAHGPWPAQAARALAELRAQAAG